MPKKVRVCQSIHMVHPSAIDRRTDLFIHVLNVLALVEQHKVVCFHQLSSSAQNFRNEIFLM